MLSDERDERSSASSGEPSVASSMDDVMDEMAAAALGFGASTKTTSRTWSAQLQYSMQSMRARALRSPPGSEGHLKPRLLRLLRAQL